MTTTSSKIAEVLTVQNDEFGRATVVTTRDHLETSTRDDNDEENIDSDELRWKKKLLEKQRLKQPQPQHSDRNSGSNDNRNSSINGDRNQRTRSAEHHHHHHRTPPPSPPLEVGIVVQGRVVRIESYGAFLEIKHHYGKRGLLHVSQMKNNTGTFIENVADVLQMGQEIYVSILEIEKANNATDRIRLSMKGINQETGIYDESLVTTVDSSNNNNNHTKNHHATIPSHLLRRAKERRQLLDQQAFESWRGDRSSNQVEPSWLHLLWPQTTLDDEKPAASSSTKKRRHKFNDSDDDSSASSDSDDSTTSSSSSESSRTRRRRRKRDADRRHKTFSKSFP